MMLAWSCSRTLVAVQAHSLTYVAMIAVVSRTFDSYSRMEKSSLSMAIK